MKEESWTAVAADSDGRGRAASRTHAGQEGATSDRAPHAGRMTAAEGGGLHFETRPSPQGIPWSRDEERKVMEIIFTRAELTSREGLERIDDGGHPTPGEVPG